ncbi:PspC domain-containing protein [Microlunatus soli]|uniref:Phage shock protein PspC (Stress-responsive transcriptional regulator) n=1 Tax=Microlunatus soli TaxID=630515 RepID=A0A1H1WZS2_9ACTN|nr:PspC domain-containing protein [Microlunatus soli]SDT02331.1 Phage shock protein PspC (stress-responsive transcriptional regulator) [Microlunatus soli]
MSYPYRQPKKLHRSRNDRWIGGVCGGLAEYLNMDATLVRILVIVLAAVTAAFPVALVYFILMALLPESQQLPPSSIGPQQRPYGADQFGPSRYSWSGQPGSASQPNSSPADPVWGAAGAPWQQQSAGSTPPPKQRPEDLFSRAKHPSQPSTPDSAPSDSAPSDTTKDETPKD